MKGVKMRSELRDSKTLPIRGFTAYDPEGYTLEFELLPDGRVLFVERPGKVRVFARHESPLSRRDMLTLLQAEAAHITH